AITFCNPAEEYHLKRIEALIRQKIPQKTLPKEVFVEKTPYREQQEIAREVDKQKRREDPNYRGAFHEKNDRNEGVKNRQKDRKKDRGGEKKGGGDESEAYAYQYRLSLHLSLVYHGI